MRTAAWAALAGLGGLFVGFGLGMGVVALRVDPWLDERKRPEDVVTVTITAADLPAGHVLTEQDVYGVQMPPRYVPAGVVVDARRAVGRTVTEDLVANELLREERLR